MDQFLVVFSKVTNEHTPFYMKKIFLLCLFYAFVPVTYAQKKLTPVTKSALTGIGLPNGSKQDSRILSVAAAATLLEMESSKTNTKVQNTEVLMLPPASLNKFNKDSLVKRLVVRNWKIIATESANYLWAQKDKRIIIAYFSINTKQTDLYLAETISSPVLTTQESNTTSNQSSTQTIVQPVNQTTPQNVDQTTQNKKENTIVNPPITTQELKKDPTQPSAPAANGIFAFSTTNFDDGWVSTVQEDWIQVTKGNTIVLIHYPNKNADVYNSVLMDGLKNAWNILVAPKYSSASNFEFKPISSWQSIEFAEADAIEKTTGKSVHVVLFKMNYSNGSGKYLEFITPDKKTFEQEFGPYHETSYGWEKVEAMANYNKFAVAATDLTGKWTNNFSGTQQYVNAYTGASAGMDTHSSNQNFEFSPQNTYKWDLSVASGFVGSIKFQSVKSSGQFSLPNNWQINFSDLEGKPKTYNAFFSCVKGARILMLEDSAYPTGYTGYGKVE
jgi:hypothetical protein